MKGSSVNNLQLDPNKQKIIDCIVCNKQIVVGKFSKKGQKCNDCKEIHTKDTAKKSEVPDKIEVGADSFVKRLQDLALSLDFEIDHNRRWRKKYAVDGGGVVTIYIGVEPGIANEKPRVDFFSMVMQRVVGSNEDFRRFMPADAASDCEVIAAEFSEQQLVKPDVGKEECDKCGVLTDEFGVDTKGGRVLCIRPNNCFKKFFNNSGAEAAD